MNRKLYQEFLEWRALISVLGRMLDEISYEEEEDKYVALAFEISDAEASMRHVALRIEEELSKQTTQEAA